MRRVGWLPMVFVGALSACTTTSFDRALHAQRWSEAVQLFSADTTLQNDERALYETALLYSSPDKGMYDPERAVRLLDRLVMQYPRARYALPAAHEAALLRELLRLQADTADWRRTRELEAQQSREQVAQLQSQIDSLQPRLRAEAEQANVLRTVVTRLESDLRDRDDQLRALRDELDRLKEIDLKRSRRSSSHDTIAKMP